MASYAHASTMTGSSLASSPQPSISSRRRPATLAPPPAQTFSMLLAEQVDPCSPTYVNTAHRGSPKTPSADKKSKLSRSKTGRVVRSVKRAMRKLFRVGKKTPVRQSFLLPYERASLNRSSSRSSMRSRRSSKWAARMTNTDGNSSPQPMITATSPSGRKRWTLHEPELSLSQLSLSPPSPVKRELRWSHPATNAVIERPTTPATLYTFLDDPSESSSRRNSLLSLPLPPSSPASSVSSIDFTGQVDPRKIFRFSHESLPLNRHPEAFKQVCNQLDGLGSSSTIDLSEALSEAPTSRRRQAVTSSMTLPYVPKLAPLSLDSDSAAASDSENEDKIERNRQVAFAQLEGAMTPAPASVATRSEPSLPLPLVPAPQTVTQAKPKHARHHTTGELYVAYPGDRFQSFGEQSKSLTKPSKGKQVADPHVRQALAEMKGINRPSTPDFAETEVHRDHYSRIESGIFDRPVLDSTPSRPANPFPPEGLATSDYFAPHSPSSAGAPAPPPKPASPPINIKRKPVRTSPNASSTTINTQNASSTTVNKTLPKVPGLADPKRYTNGVVPSLLAMNDNGFPLVGRDSAYFSIAPKYAQRSLTPMEEKVRREQAAKAAEDAKKAAAKQAKLERKQKVKGKFYAVSSVLVCGRE